MITYPCRNSSLPPLVQSVPGIATTTLSRLSLWCHKRHIAQHACTVTIIEHYVRETSVCPQLAVFIYWQVQFFTTITLCNTLKIDSRHESHDANFDVIHGNAGCHSDKFGIMTTRVSVMSSCNPLWPGDAIWRNRSGSTLTQVVACCLTVTSHYLNQCGWIIGDRGLVAFTWKQFKSECPS